MLDLLSSRRKRRLLFTALYFSEGAPIGFIWWALPARLRTEGINVQQITSLTAALVLPWTFKFLWAPLIDRCQSRRWTLKHWIVASQLGMGLCLWPLLKSDLVADFSLMAAVLFAHAMLAATQDAAIDALCIRTTTSLERGRLNGWMQAGMLLGRALLGGGVLALAAQIGDRGVVALLIGAIWSSMLLLLMTRVPEQTEVLTEQSRSFHWSSLWLVAKQRSTWMAFAFALTGGAAFEGVGALGGPLMIDMGLSSETVGYLYAVPLVACTILGALAGGRWADRHGHRRTVTGAVLLIVIAAATVGLSTRFHSASHDEAEAASTALIVSLTVVYLGIGIFTAASYALFMDVTSPSIAATQFSALMGATNGCEVWCGYVAGRLVSSSGYAFAIGSLCAVSLASLIWLRLFPESQSRT